MQHFILVLRFLPQLESSLSPEFSHYYIKGIIKFFPISLEDIYIDEKDMLLFNFVLLKVGVVRAHIPPLPAKHPI